VTKAIVDHTGFAHVSFGNILGNCLEEKGLPRTREALQAFGQNVKDQYGYEGFLDWSIDTVNF